MELAVRHYLRDLHAAHRLRLAPARVEKPRQCGTSRGEDERLAERRGAQATRRRAYRFETAGGSAWNGPVLDARYAAQVIGQAVVGGTAPSTASCYRAQLGIGALLVDSKV